MSLDNTVTTPFKKLALYARNYGVSAIIDVSIYAAVLVFVKPIFTKATAILFANSIARILSSLVNFYLNKSLFAKKHISYINALQRYYMLWLLLLVSSSFMIYLLNDLFYINEITAKMISDTTLGLFSYQIQMRWVFNENQKKKKGLYFRIVRKIARLFLKMEVIIDEKIFLKENVLVGHHQNFYGPISSIIWLPDTVSVWVISHLFDFKECFNMYYNYTFKKSVKLPRVVAFFISTLCALLIPPFLKSSRSIPVYRESRKIVETFSKSIDLLNKGEQVLIFPDVKYDDSGQNIGKIYTGFTHLEKLYYKSNNTHLAFIPIRINKTTKTITNTQPIQFNADNTYKAGKEILVKQIIENINMKEPH